MNAPAHARRCPRRPVGGFSLLEALIGLVIMAFSLLTLVSVNLKLMRSEDVARQRGEAATLAQERIEQMRDYTQIASSANRLAWNDLASGNDVIDSSVDYATNTRFERRWRLLGTAADPMRRLQVTVNWVDRTDEPQTVTFSTMISKSDPADVGAIGFPLPANTTLKRPKNRNLNIPVPAVDLGNGQSVVQLQNNFAVVFSNTSGYVVKTCDFVVHTEADLATCTTAAAYIVAGYISLSGTATFPTGLGVNSQLLNGSTSVTCSIGAAVNQNNGTNLAGYKYYLCVVSVPSEGAPWSGTLRLSGAGLNAGPDYLVCRFQFADAGGATPNQRNVQPYADVAESIDNQNYVITTGNSCPVVSDLATVLHQDCRHTNASRAGSCPAS